MLKINNITLVCINGIVNKNSDSIKAINKSLCEIQYDNVIFFTCDLNINNLPNFVKIEFIKSMNWLEYNKFIIQELYKYIKTKYILLIQDDGFVVNPKCFKQDFYLYDYIGAGWSDNCLVPTLKLYNKDFSNLDKYRVGNGGFSWRSNKLMEYGSTLDVEFNGPEDVFYSIIHREKFENNNFKFAPLNIAQEFSQEHIESIISFGFHGKHLLNKFNI